MEHGNCKLAHNNKTTIQHNTNNLYNNIKINTNLFGGKVKPKKGKKNMAKRIFYQEKVYDYSTISEAKEHIEQMRGKGWHPRNVDYTERTEQYISQTACADYPYTVAYFKEL